MYGVVNQMLKNENIICISSIDWDFVWQGHQEIMSTFAKNGNRVLFIENTGIRTPGFRDIPRLKKRIINWFKGIKGFREEMDNLYVYSPLILPFPYSRSASYINRYLMLGALGKWMKVTDFYEPIVWTFLPTETALNIINNIGRKLLVYYCIADFYALAGNYKKVKKTENELIKKSDLIFVQGKVLRDKCKRLNSNVHIFPFGVKSETFENFQQIKAKTPADIKDIKKPIVGYVGGIHKHIDFQLLKFIVENYPEWSIVLVGPIQTATHEINNLRNIFLLGKKCFSDLPYYINEFDVCIIPYLKTEYTATVYPTKLNEYHALGKPVVSTDLAEVINFNAENNNLVLVAKSYEEFIKHIFHVLNEPNGISLCAHRIQSSKKNNWNTRIEEMSNLVRMALEKRSKLPFEWRESFLRLYRKASRRMLRAVSIFLSIYILIFYTPLFWFVASPLKISQQPQKADCIVVFAGGVGESGKAGQGYEERVQYAVNLYKKGYANYIIFSSGYKFIFEEPMLMKVLAVSLGIPEKAIILEEKAKNTYENVKLVKGILEKEKWKNILLVSSPYHMRRAYLVIKKVAPEIKTTYTPLPKSAFYNDINTGKKHLKLRKQIEIQQIKGILHEYLGIVYYYFKGYI